jgi:hypothetical protein
MSIIVNWDVLECSLYSITLNGESILNREHNVGDIRRFIDLYRSKVIKIRECIRIFLIKLYEQKDLIDEVDGVYRDGCLENIIRYNDLDKDFMLIENFLDTIEEVNNKCRRRGETDTDDMIKQDRRCRKIVMDYILFFQFIRNMTLAGYFIGLEDTEISGDVINIENNEELRNYILFNKERSSIFNYSYSPF